MTDLEAAVEIAEQHKNDEIPSFQKISRALLATVERVENLERTLAQAIEEATHWDSVRAGLRSELTEVRAEIEVLSENLFIANKSAVDLRAEVERLKGEAVLQQLHYSDKLKELKASHVALLEKAKGALRQAIEWGECLSLRVPNRSEINWRVVEEARAALAELEALK